MSREEDLARFYSLLDDLRTRLGGERRLADCASKDWPQRGVYFFFEEEEYRADGQIASQEA